jgi:hypothetical protein
MLTNLTDRAQQALALAPQESKRYRHDFIGTEHILLALIADETGEVARILQTFGIDAPRIRRHVEWLCAPGTSDRPASVLPFTPRANRALKIAAEESRDAAQKSVDTGHLLLGLLREPDGVAGKVLAQLGVELLDLREEVLKIRRAQMKLVERCVRPVRASAPRRRKMREELLAHLSGIYEEELARGSNPAVALHAAVDRFGDPVALAAELNRSLPLSERLGRYINPNLTRRPNESPARYMLRVAAGITAFVAIFHCILILLVTFKDGWNTSLILAKPILAALPFMFVDTLVLGLLYLKLRDAMWGTPWTQRSKRLVLAAGALITLVSFGSASTFNLLAGLDPAHAVRALYITMLVAAVTAVVFPMVALVHGPEQISDAVWAALDIDSAPPAVG